MKKRYTWLLGLILGLSFSACSDDDAPGAGEAKFINYAIRGYNEKAVIDADRHTVYLRLPDTVTNGEGMCPEFEVSPGAILTMNQEEQRSGARTMDFSQVQLYTLTSANGQRNDRWYVNVTNNDYTAAYGIGNFLTYSHSNNGRGDFYRQQQHTGEYSDVNCGPACGVMAALFVDPSFEGTVEEARRERPTNADGGTWWYDNTAEAYLYDHGIRSYWWNFGGWDKGDILSQVCIELDWGAIALCCLDISWITEQRFSDKGYHADKFYHTNGWDAGHFIILKGYCVVNGQVWFEVHDPWGIDMVYADGTPMGANRYYRADEVIGSNLYWNRGWMLFVPPHDKQ